MGKIIVIIGFLIFFFSALYIFITIDKKAPIENIKTETVKTPRIILSDFTHYNYEKGSLASSLSARLGYLIDPNIVEVFGDVRGKNYKKDGGEVIKAESGRAYFGTDDLDRMFQNAQMEKAELKGMIEIEFHDHKLLTDYAEYSTKENVVSSTRPTRIEGNKRWFIGQNGFRYDLTKEHIVFDGPIEGEVVPSESR